MAKSILIGKEFFYDKPEIKHLLRIGRFDMIVGYQKLLIFAKDNKGYIHNPPDNNTMTPLEYFAIIGGVSCESMTDILDYFQAMGEIEARGLGANPLYFCLTESI